MTNTNRSIRDVDDLIWQQFRAQASLRKLTSAQYLKWLVLQDQKEFELRK